MSSSSSLGERHGRVPGGALQTEERLPASLPSWTALRSPQQPGGHVPSGLKAPPLNPRSGSGTPPPPQLVERKLGQRAGNARGSTQSKGVETTSQSTA